MPSREPIGRSSIEDRIRPLDASPDAMPSTPEERRPRRLGSGTVVVLLMAGVAVVGLYSMRSLGRAAASEGLGREIESLVAGVLSSGDADASADRSLAATPAVDDTAVFAMLDTDFRGRLQVPWEALGRDPFEPWRDPNAVDTSASETIPVDARRAAGEAWGREVDRIVGLLELKSLIGGGTAGGMANINGRIIRRGDVFNVAEAEADFRVVAIERGGVRLRAVHPRLGIEREAFIEVRRPF